METKNGIGKAISSFLEAHREGWNHNEWLGLLDHLEVTGHDLTDPGRLGEHLERERLRMALSETALRGLGPRRIEAIAGAFKTLWDLRESDAGGITAKAGLPMGLAEQVLESIRA